MTPLRLATWRFCAQYSEEYGYGPTLSEIAKHFGISSLATAKKRVDALISMGYCERGLGKKSRLKVLLVPADGMLRLHEALAMSEECVRLGERVVSSAGPFTREDVMALGWEAA